MNYQLHLGDCLEFMRTMPAGSVDAVVTDPPYGIDHIHAGGRSSVNGWNDGLYRGEWDKNRPAKVYFDEILRIAKIVVIWGGNYFIDYLHPTMRWLIWDKGQRNFSLADFEMAWTNQNNASRIYDYPRSMALQDGKEHPTQKPVSVIKWCIEICRITAAATVLDPFMGSGTTGVACLQTGRKFIGIERERQYFDIGVKRMHDSAQHVLLPGM